MRSVRWSAVIAVVSLAAVPLLAGAAVWTHVGTSAFHMGDGSMYDPYETRAENYLTDANRIKLASLVADPAGNVFAICNDGENNTYSVAGGVTVFRADQAVVDIDLRALGLFGGLTRLVLAGDGMVYGVQNYAEINWAGGHRGVPHRILRLTPDGNAQIVWEAPDVFEGEPASNKSLIRGIATGPGGHVYWIMNGASEYWRYNFLWRYNIVTGIVEPAPINQPGVDNGKGETYGLNPFEYVGGEWFIVARKDGSGVELDAIAWTHPRRNVINEQGGTWAADRTVCLAYDPARRKLWHGPRGTSEPTIPGPPDLDYFTAIMSRWEGETANPGLFSETVDAPKSGIVDLNTSQSEDAAVWHMNGNDPFITLQSNGGKYWCGALAVNPADGTAWMSWGADKYLQEGFDYVGFGPFAPVGAVYTVGNDGTGPAGDEGTPRLSAPLPSWVMALAFGERGGACYAFALTCDLNDGQYDLYQAPVDCPPTGACCQRGNICTSLSRVACQAVGGTYLGDGTACGQTTCNVTGACCHQGNQCTQELPTDCTKVTQAFQGVGVDCAGVDCRFRVCQEPTADTDGDGDVDSLDFGVLQSCLTVGGGTISDEPFKCGCLDRNGDGALDTDDLDVFVLCGSGPGVSALPDCDD